MPAMTLVYIQRSMSTVSFARSALILILSNNATRRTTGPTIDPDLARPRCFHPIPTPPLHTSTIRFRPGDPILLYTITRTALQTLKWVPFTPTPAHIKGRYSAMPPLSLAEGEPQPMVVFVLGFDSSHPLGKLGPGLKELGQYFLEIIKEAEDTRSTSGYLGTSGPMLTMDGETSNALVTITYWRSLKELEAFNKQGAHLRAIQWFNSTREKYPHIGIMHELYNVPAGHHENVYYNYRPFGLVNTSYLVDGELGEKEVVKAEVVKEGQGLESSYGRMKRGMKA